MGSEGREAASGAAKRGIAYEETDALGLAEWVRKGEVSPDELLDEALTRLERWNPAIGAVVIPMEEQARRAIAAGLPEGPFRGVPFLLKDLHLLVAGVPTTQGCRLFADFVPDHDSELVVRYRDAGLVAFGKSASPEFGITCTTESRLFGATRNPWNLERSAGGSSGGAAAAVAAGILPLANASDGGGSIRIPASCCGLFGLKPTRGRTPMGPDAGEGWSGMSCIHAVSRTVRDNAALLDATHGPDRGAPYVAPAPERPFLAEVGAAPGRLRIALQTEAFNGTETHPDCVAAAEDAARLCEALGHTVVEARFRTDVERFRQATGTIIAANLRLSLQERAAALGREVSAEDVEPITWLMASGAAASDAAAYAGAQRAIHRIGRELAAFFEDVDLLLTPTLGAPPRPIGVLSLSNPNVPEALAALFQAVGFSQVANAAGTPAMSVPLSWNGEGLPIGVQFMAPYGDEATLFRLAAQLEEARPWARRRPPPVGD
jgi:amidase